MVSCLMPADACVMLNYHEMGDSKDISNKYRKKISFINFGDKFVIQGNLDLDTSKPSPVAINGSSTKNEKGLYIGEGLFAIDDKKNKKEYIGIFLKPFNLMKKLLWILIIGFCRIN